MAAFQRDEVIRVFTPQEGNMIRLAVLYPQTRGSTFDMDYYLNKPVPMVICRLAPMGLMKAEIDEGVSGFPPDQPAPTL